MNSSKPKFVWQGENGHLLCKGRGLRMIVLPVPAAPDLTHRCYITRNGHPVAGIYAPSCIAATEFAEAVAHVLLRKRRRKSLRLADIVLREGDE